jgi:hypothetical protein
MLWAKVALATGMCPEKKWNGWHARGRKFAMQTPRLQNKYLLTIRFSMRPDTQRKLA